MSVLVTGASGFLGKELCRQLRASGIDPAIPTRRQCDLLNTQQTGYCILQHKPDVVYHLAADCGGIGYNEQFPARLCRDNLVMGINVLDACRAVGVKKLVMVGTVCSYAKHCPAPFPEEYLWHGYPEETNAPYGIAKRALLTLAQAYRAQYGLRTAYVIPTNLYGPGDHFETDRSHVIPAMVRKFVEAEKSVTLWGTGESTREFLHVSDAARALMMAADRYDDPMPVNIGSGEEISMGKLANKIARLVGFDGEIEWDGSKPDGQPRRLVSTGRARAMGFEASVRLDAGLKETVDWYREQKVANSC